MIQRIQSVYLLLSAVVIGGLQFMLSLWTTASETIVTTLEKPVYLAGFIVSSLLSIVCIGLYKSRKNQFVLNRLTIILNFILLIGLVYESLTLSGEAAVSKKGIGMLLPIISIVLIVLANKAIKKDENLVKSVDRLR